MAADAPEKSARKHKKTKTLEGAEPAGDAAVARAEKPRKSKKARTDNPAADDAQETADNRAAVSGAEDIPAPKKEKKSKKRKHAEAEVELAEGDAEKPEKKKKREKVETAVVEDVEQSPVTEPKSSKKAKGKKRKAEEASEEVVGAGKAVAEDSDVDPAAQSEPRPPKREKRDKKRVQNIQRDEVDVGDAASSSKPQKKRKRRSASGFPDPTVDEALSEQAQKALDYAFTQFEEPDKWKFNKARQNWIIRNVWSEEAIPQTYLPLASKYLQGVQGGAREALVKSCRDAIEAPQPTAEPAAAEESKVARVESESAKDSHTKRTVKFEVPATPSNTVNDTKRKRATDLLALLTSNTS
ncbi:hypothetical protein VTO73DRAFT_14805 [Trametes versicolor]